MDGCFALGVTVAVVGGVIVNAVAGFVEMILIILLVTVLTLHFKT